MEQMFFQQKTHFVGAIAKATMHAEELPPCKTGDHHKNTQPPLKDISWHVGGEVWGEEKGMER